MAEAGNSVLAEGDHYQFL